jgi:precorrin isomerase
MNLRDVSTVGFVAGFIFKAVARETARYASIASLVISGDDGASLTAAIITAVRMPSKWRNTYEE